MNNAFTVKVGEVEGPLDLILDLIEERTMLVSDLSLSKIADDFIAYVKTRESFPAGQAAQFILVAATLLLIKSRSLLPILSLSDEEEGDIKDLERRLALYGVYRSIAKKLGAFLGRPLFLSGLRRDADPVFAPSRDMTAESLESALLMALSRAPRAERLFEVEIVQAISLEEMMARLSERIERALSMTFRDFVGSPDDKREIVVGFLAILELMKRGLVAAEQDEGCTEIRMTYAGHGAAPRYE